MSFSWIADSHGVTAGYSTSYTVSKPTGTAVGDLLVFIGAGGTSTPATISGFTVLGTGADSTGGPSVGRCIVQYRVVTGTEPSSWTINMGGGTASLACGVMATYRGVDTTNPIDTTNFSYAADTNGGTAFSQTAVTCNGKQASVAWVIQYISGSNAILTWTEGSGTERADFGEAGGSPDACSMNYNDDIASLHAAGSVTRTETCSSGYSLAAGGIFLLNPAGTTAAAGSASATAAANNITATKIPGVGAGKAAATAAANNPAVNIGAVAGKASVTAAGFNADRGRLLISGSATAAANNATVRIGWLARPGVATVTSAAMNPFYVGIGIFPGNGTVSASAFNPVVIVPGDAIPARTYHVPVEVRSAIADPGDIRTISVPPDA